MTGRQVAALKQHLFPGDNKEAVALAFCGMGQYSDGLVNRKVVCVHEIVAVEYEMCSRFIDRITWKTDLLPDILQKANRKNQLILKIHSHPTGFAIFSDIDDKADKDFFRSVGSWLNSEFGGISAIMLPDSRIIARTVNSDGTFGTIDIILIAGPDILIWQEKPLNNFEPSNFNLRAIQAFGKGTPHLLSQLSIGVVGISGTGSPVVEMLARLGVGALVLIDDDVVKEQNLDRIYNSSQNDVVNATKKVHVLKEAVERTGLPSKVEAIPKNLFQPEVVRRLAQCDVIFGCMDSVDGRHILNKLCTFYSIPYFDLGVHLEADGMGGVSQVSGTVHYLQPDGSSLLSRRVYSSEKLRSADLKRTNPTAYREQVASKYIEGIDEDRPAVISINTLLASLAVNDFLARIHQFRDDTNDEIAAIRFSLTQTRMIVENEGSPCSLLSPDVGQGDTIPLLGIPDLSERRD